MDDTADRKEMNHGQTSRKERNEQWMIYVCKIAEHKVHTLIWINN